MLAPDRWHTREQVIKAFEAELTEFEVVYAMAKVGWAFCQIQVFEGLVHGLILTASKVRVGKPQKYSAFDVGARMLLKNEKLSKSMLGQMTSHLKNAGIGSRDAHYLELLVKLRNEFIHRFTHQVPLPGDWERFRFSAHQFAAYPQYVGTRFEYGCHYFPKIMLNAGLLTGTSGDFGRLLWDPDDEFWADDK